MAEPPLPSAFAHLLDDHAGVDDGDLPPALAAALRVALVEAQRGVGRTTPNPAVGCALLDGDGGVAAVGFHARAGCPHAEVNALDALISARGPGAARGLTAVVTLEPCAHVGRTPPCTDRLIKEGVARVVVGTVDPNPRVHGQGIAALRAAGVEVVLAAGRLAAQCRALIAPFAATMTAGRAYVVLKVAASLDGLTATRTGASLYITGPQSRGLVHALRDACDGVVVGAGTVIHDDPALTVRDHRRRDGSATRDPRRVVLDRQAQVPLTARVLDPPGALLVHGAHTTPKPLVGVETLALTAEPHLDLSALAEALPGHGVSSALIEAGPRLAAAFVSAGLVDELWWFRAPLLVGGDGQRAIASLGVDALAAAARFRPVHAQRVGDDDLVILRPVS